jgi:hypothetical protein
LDSLPPQIFSDFFSFAIYISCARKQIRVYLNSEKTLKCGACLAALSCHALRPEWLLGAALSVVRAGIKALHRQRLSEPPSCPSPPTPPSPSCRALSRSATGPSCHLASEPSPACRVCLVESLSRAPSLIPPHRSSPLGSRSEIAEATVLESVVGELPSSCHPRCAATVLSPASTLPSRHRARFLTAGASRRCRATSVPAVARAP